jgi:hypothetical protein
VEQLSACREYLGLAEHTRNIVQQFSPSSDPEEVRKWLEDLAADGALVSDSEWSDSSAPAGLATERSAPGIEWLAMPTRSRPVEALAALRS